MKKSNRMNNPKLPITALRARHLGLSNELFCNKSNHAAKIQEGSIVIRNVGGNEKGCPEGLAKARAKVKEQGYSGKMSRATRSKVGGIIGAWVHCLKAHKSNALGGTDAAAREMVFVTLTLSSKQMHSDNYCKRHMLGRFLTEMQRQHGAARYFWRAEPQKNGNIHFHVLLDKHIDWKEIRSTWNKIQADNGYIDEYRKAQKEYHKNGFKARPELFKVWPLEKQIKAYAYGVRKNWSDPNSTDVHSLQKVKNCAAYICKYVSKEGGARKIEGRIWGCTDSLRELSMPEVYCREEFIYMVNHLADAGELKKIVCEHATIYKGDIVDMLRNYAPELLDAVNMYYADLNTWLRQYTDTERKHEKHKFKIKVHGVEH